MSGSHKSNIFLEVKEEDNGSEATDRNRPMSTMSKFKKEYEDEDYRDTSPFTTGKRKLYADILES